VALIFGFNAICVPLMLALDEFFTKNEPGYDQNKNHTRIKMILATFVSGCFWGLSPLFGWSKIDFEPSGLSCTVWEPKPKSPYVLYIVLCVLFYFLMPVFVMICSKREEAHSMNFNEESDESSRVNWLF
jgi:hypothetical protein